MEVAPLTNQNIPPVSAAEAGVLSRLRDSEVLELTRDLIRIPGHQDLPQQEADVARHLAAVLRREGLDVELSEVEPGRPNVIARLRGTGGGYTLLFNGHIDTIPAYDMPDAFTPRLEGNRLYGRGAVDMLGAVAAMAQAMIVLKRSGLSLPGDLVLTAVVGEENGSPGTHHLVKTGIQADFAIIGEATGMEVAVAHRGISWFEVVFHGVSTHGSVPDKGINAIYHASRFVRAIEEELVPRLRTRTHPLMNHSTVNLGVIGGGTRPTMVPERCTVQLDRRWVPGETPASVMAEIQEILDRLAAADPQFRAELHEMKETANFEHWYLDCPVDAPVVQELVRATGALTGRPAPIVGVGYWTDAALLGKQGGVPSVVCGPGDIVQAHSSAEYVTTDQLYLAARVYLLTALRLLSATRK